MTERKCGKCWHFDIANKKGELWGSAVINGKEVAEGVCRTNKRLPFGILHEETGCKHPPGHFLSRNTIAPSLANVV